MPRKPNSSPQTRRVLAVLAGDPSVWRHGLALAGETGLSSGTLYPLLSRLREGGYLESEWLEPEVRGRPPRQVYRLTAAGRALAREMEAAAPAGSPPAAQTA
jgi:PadR family transcriptional regulator PadR